MARQATLRDLTVEEIKELRNSGWVQTSTHPRILVDKEGKVWAYWGGRDPRLCPVIKTSMGYLTIGFIKWQGDTARAISKVMTPALKLLK